MSTSDVPPGPSGHQLSRLYNWAGAGSEALGFAPPGEPATPPAPIVLDADRHGRGPLGLLRRALSRKHD